LGVPGKLGRLENNSKGSDGGGFAVSCGMLEKLISFHGAKGHHPRMTADSSII
jgi:hypothetical protein